MALVYPNTYHQAMSNLGFLSVYHLLNGREDALCERFFLPDREDLAEHRKTGYPLFSLESGRFLGDFDLIAFSVSFENDYLNLPVLFELARIPLFAADRGERYPLVLCGGVCAFLNPEPLAEVMDLFAVGEAEVMAPPLVEILNGAGESPDESCCRGWPPSRASTCPLSTGSNTGRTERCDHACPAKGRRPGWPASGFGTSTPLPVAPSS